MHSLEAGNKGKAASKLCPTCGPPACIVVGCSGTMKLVLGRRFVLRCVSCGKEASLQEILKARGKL